tara:strand:- start:231 stop:422 length:192 start_codon:yes stop_codon:yes gene_type:complete
MDGQWEKPMWGSLRITNPKTLLAWKESGKYQELIDDGYTYAKGCGRFRTEECKCSKCRKLKQK